MYPLRFEEHLDLRRAEYAARVELSGDAIGIRDGREFVVHGVRPGGFVGIGDTLEEACQKHTEGLHRLLEDILNEAPSFEEFERRTEEFLSYTSEWAKQQFEAATAVVSADTAATPNPLLDFKTTYSAAVPRKGRRESEPESVPTVSLLEATAV